MNAIHSAILLIVLLQGVYSYSKFGRKCDDIGCASNEECVMASKPCSYFDRKDECGEYPTCKKVNNGARTCDTYVCPPSKVCKMDGGIPKCFDDSSKAGKVAVYDTSNINNKYDNHNGQVQPNAPSANHNPSAPTSSGGSLYPNVHQGGYNPGYQQPAGGVQRPTGNYGGYPQPPNNYNGYSGNYPGYNNNRPTGGYGQQGYNPGGYNGQGGYRPQQQPGGYYIAGAGYQHPAPNSGYGSFNNRYPNTGYGYNQGYYIAGAGYQQPASNNGYGSNDNNFQNAGGYGYNPGYSGYGSNTGYGNNGNGQYGAKGAGSSFTDSLKDALKKIGSDFLQKAVSGALKTQ